MKRKGEIMEAEKSTMNQEKSKIIIQNIQDNYIFKIISTKICHSTSSTQIDCQEYTVN